MISLLHITTNVKLDVKFRQNLAQHYTLNCRYTCHVYCGNSDKVAIFAETKHTYWFRCGEKEVLVQGDHYNQLSEVHCFSLLFPNVNKLFEQQHKIGDITHNCWSWTEDL